jgi:hypothetical protein
MNLPEQALEYESEQLVDLAICYFEGAGQMSHTLTVLEDAVANLLANGTPEDQQVAQIVHNDILHNFYTLAPPASVESETESESEEELNAAFCSSPVGRPPRLSRPLNLMEPVYQTPYRPLPPLPIYDIIEFPIADPLDETIEWVIEEARDENNNNRLAARYDFTCDCCNYPVRIELFY